MKPRERVQITLSHEEPDRVPLDLGGPATSLLVDTYENLKRYLEVKTPTRMHSKTWQTVEVGKAILRILDIDTRYVFEKGLKGKDEDEESPYFVDEWGVTRSKIGYYYEITKFPLREIKLEDLDNYPWPDPLKPERMEGLRKKAEQLRQETDYAVVGHCSGSIFELSWYLRGYDQFMMDLIADKEFAQALLRKLTDIQKLRATAFLKEVGEYLDVITYGDDLGIHVGPAISPQLYREMVKPYHQELHDLVHSLTKAKLWYHSCGDVYPLISDLIDVGVDILNPIQVSTKRMGNTGKLKKEFGHNMSFWGAIDTQKVMPFGSVEEVRQEVERRIKDLAPGGGYVVAGIHNLCPDVSPENICAMFQAARDYGEYPIS